MGPWGFETSTSPTTSIRCFLFGKEPLPQYKAIQAVSTHLKNTSQSGSFRQIGMNIKKCLSCHHLENQESPEPLPNFHPPKAGKAVNRLAYEHHVSIVGIQRKGISHTFCIFCIYYLK